MKKRMLKRTETLANAAKFAREQANSIEAEDKKVGKEVFDYLFGD